MPILSSTQTINRYHVSDPCPDNSESVAEMIRSGLISNAMPKVKDDYSEIVVGWVPYDGPYDPDFEKYDFRFGIHMVFSLRIDKKTIPAKTIEEQMSIAIQKKLQETDRDFISKNEKAELKELILDKLMFQVPFVPSIYDVVWDYDSKSIWFLSTQKSANELFENLFLRSFKLKLHQIFPYTLADRDSAELIDLVSLTTPTTLGRAS